MKLYWISAIIQNKDDEKPWLCSMYKGLTSLEKALEVVAHTKEIHTVLSAWIDTFDENMNKQIVFHECYIDIFGNVRSV